LRPGKLLCSWVLNTIGCGGSILPDIMEIKPLIRCPATVCRQTLGIACSILVEQGTAFTARQRQDISKRFKGNAILLAVFQGEQQKHRAFQQGSQDKGALRERCRKAQEWHTAYTMGC